MSASKEVFEKYPNRIFIETGTYKGEGILMAIKAGFPMIYSIELSLDLFGRACLLFGEDDSIVPIHGDSATMLEKLLKDIDEPCTFWLDAHFSGGDTVRGAELSPIMRELKVIKNHHIKTHTILMDDIRDWVSHGYGCTLDSAKAYLKTINPNYKFVLEDGFTYNDILVAVP